MSVYLDRYAYLPLQIENPPHPDTGMIIVIPVFNETILLNALDSLVASKAPPVPIEIIIIINESENSDSAITNQNKLTFTAAQNWISTHKKEGLSFYLTHLILPKKHAGVGLARKAGMDEATRRFETIGNKNGIILCFDADCTCAPNYLSEVYRSFTQKKLKGASIYYAHKVANLTKTEKEGILQYELHLRYYVNGLRKAGYPYAFHTVGSSMAVRVDIYKKTGGMNRRKAGEDFHFLHKVIPFGDFEEINSTTVYPSPRISSRVPFGTGKAMDDWINQSKSTFYSYHPSIFKEIEQLLKLVHHFYKNENISEAIKNLSAEIKFYLELENFESIIKDINRQSSNLKTFIHRWFGWFNGLKALHLVHFLRDKKYASIPINKAATKLIKVEKCSTEELLEKYRDLDKKFTANQINLKHRYYEHR